MENQFQKLSNQTGGHHVILRTLDHHMILKPYDQNQHDFYQGMYNSAQNSIQKTFIKYLPHYQGVCMLQDQIKQPPKEIIHNSPKKYLKLENITYSMANPCILDVKLGIKKWKASHVKFKNSTTCTHNFRMCGVTVYQEKLNRVVHKDKYYHHNVGLNEIEMNLGFYFYDGEQIKTKLIQNLIKKLQKIIECLKEMKGYKFESMSLLIAYDGKANIQNNINCYLIDFDQYSIQKNNETDENRLKGLVCLNQFLKNIVKNQEQVTNKIVNCKDFEFE